MGFVNFMREKIRNFLQIQNANNQQIFINQKLDFFANTVKNKIWYRGNSQELSELYGQLDVPATMFWKATCTKEMEIRKIHTGLPKLMINALTNIVIGDFNGVEINDDNLSKIWEEIAEENKFDKVLRKSIKKFLMIGDGAFKVTFDKNVSEKKPIIEYVSGENIDFKYNRGRLTEIIFVTEYVNNHKKYYFKEYYGFGYIKYKLFNNNGEELPLNFIPQTSWCKGEGVTFDKSVRLAIPVIYGDSEQYDGRGESIFDGKTDDFDSLDEAWSQWMDALRAGRTKEYIPECFIPRDPKTGKHSMKSNAFDNRFIQIESDNSESGNGNKIYTESPTIQHESYLATYITALDMCLQGVISPSTLGIDVKKLDNADAQREKEKTTLYTRNNIIELLNEVIPEVIVSALAGYQHWNKLKIEKPKVIVKFGEYANPSFESQIETVAKGRSAKILSVEAGVEELYGDSKDKEWKEKEVVRLKEEQGIAVVTEPQAADDTIRKVGFYDSPNNE